MSEITLPPTLTVIGQHAFSDCSSLSEIALPPTLAKSRSDRLLPVHILARDRAAA